MPSPRVSLAFPRAVTGSPCSANTATHETRSLLPPTVPPGLRMPRRHSPLLQAGRALQTKTTLGQQRLTQQHEYTTELLVATALLRDLLPHEPPRRRLPSPAPKCTERPDANITMRIASCENPIALRFLIMAMKALAEKIREARGNAPQMQRKSWLAHARIRKGFCVKPVDDQWGLAAFTTWLYRVSSFTTS